MTPLSGAYSGLARTTLGYVRAQLENEAPARQTVISAGPSDGSVHGWVRQTPTSDPAAPHGRQLDSWVCWIPGMARCALFGMRPTDPRIEPSAVGSGRVRRWCRTRPAADGPVRRSSGGHRLTGRGFNFVLGTHMANSPRKVQNYATKHSIVWQTPQNSSKSQS